jgi:VanZ family protein
LFKELFTEQFELRGAVCRGFLCAVSKFRLFAKYWLPVVFWAALIFSASGDSRSVQHSSRIIEPLVRWLIPNISDEAMRTTVFTVRKCAHVTEFAVLALLLLRAAGGTLWKKPAGWNGRAAVFAVVGAAVFAISDEIHQTFVPGRQGAILDVLIDSAGAAAGLYSHWQAGRWRKKW